MDKIKIKLYLEELKKIKSKTYANNISIFLVKGLAFSKVIYNNLYARDCNDIDLIVRETDMKKVDKIMLELGYTRDLGLDEANKEYNNVPLEYKTTYDYHEHNYIKQLDSFIVRVEIKKTTSSIDYRYINDFRNNLEAIELNDFSINSLDLNHTFLLLSANTYENNEPALFDSKRIYLRDYYDLKTFLDKYKEQLDWSNLVALANQYKMVHKLYYVLTQLCKLYVTPDYSTIRDYFKKEHINYDYMGYDHGGIVDWNQSFLSRVFSDPEVLKQQFYSLLKKRYFSEINLNYPAFPLEQIKSGRGSTSLFYTDKKYGTVKVEVTFAYDEKHFIIMIQSPESLDIILDDFDIVFVILGDGDNPKIPEKYISITKDNESIFYKFLHANIEKDIFEEVDCKDTTKDIDLKNNNTLKVYYPLKHLDLMGSNGEICLNFWLSEKIYSYLYQAVGKYYDVLNPGVFQIPLHTIQQSNSG